MNTRWIGRASAAFCAGRRLDGDAFTCVPPRPHPRRGPARVLSRLRPMPPAKRSALSRVPTRFGTRFKTNDDQGGCDRPRIEHVRQTQRGEPRSRRMLVNGGDDRDHSEPRRFLSAACVLPRFPDMLDTTALAVFERLGLVDPVDPRARRRHRGYFPGILSSIPLT